MTEPKDQQDCDSCFQRASEPHPIFDLCKEKRFDEALELCRRQIDENPDCVIGYGNMASVFELMKKRDEAVPYRNKVIELDPLSTMSYYARADLFYEMGDYRAAIADFTRSAELDHQQVLGPANYLYRADCYRRLGEYDNAIADCALVPDDFDFPGFLGQWEGTKHHLLAEIARERGQT